MYTLRSLIYLIVFSLFISACTQQPSRQTVGTLGGAAVGGAVGSLFGGGTGKVGTTLAGALIGGLIGGSIGRYMDENDRVNTGYALESVQTGNSYTWKNPDSGNSYSVTPTKTYYQNDQPCREFTTTATIGGKNEEVYGTACRMADGSWKTVS